MHHLEWAAILLIASAVVTVWLLAIFKGGGN
jgi:hypothetical protein